MSEDTNNPVFKLTMDNNVQLNVLTRSITTISQGSVATRKVRVSGSSMNHCWVRWWKNFENRSTFDELWQRI